MPRALAALSAVLAALMTLASLAGLLIGDLYAGDNALVRTGWYGNDLVTLVVATPLLLGALAFAPRLRRARLVWLGMLAYVVYNYAFYLLGARFNALFLVYVALVAGGGCALVGGLATLDRPSAPMASRRLGTVAVYMGLVACLLGTFWVGVTVQALWVGEVPAMVSATGTYTNLTAALDLCLVVVPGLIGAVWLWNGYAWGYVIAVVWNVKGAVYMSALTSATLAARRAGALDDAALASVWAAIGLGCAMAAVALLTRPGIETHEPRLDVHR